MGRCDRAVDAVCSVCLRIVRDASDLYSCSFAYAATLEVRHREPAAASRSVFYVYQPHVGARSPSSLGGRAPRAAVVGLTITAPQRSPTNKTPAQLRILTRQSAAPFLEDADSTPDSKPGFSLACLSCSCRLTMRGAGLICPSCRAPRFDLHNEASRLSSSQPSREYLALCLSATSAMDSPSRNCTLRIFTIMRGTLRL